MLLCTPYRMTYWFGLVEQPTDTKRQPLRARLDSAAWGKTKDALRMKREKHVRRAKWTPPEVLKLWKAISK